MLGRNTCGVTCAFYVRAVSVLGVCFDIQMCHIDTECWIFMTSLRHNGVVSLSGLNVTFT